MRNPFTFFPLSRIDGRKPGVSLRFQRHVGYHEAVGAPDCLRVDLGPADDGDFGIAAPQRVAARDRKGGVEALRGHDARNRESARAAHDDVGAPGKRLADREVSLAAHHHRPADGRGAKMFQVGFEPPRQGTALPDHTVVADRRDQDESDAPRARGRAHTATAALMCGCGS